MRARQGRTGEGQKDDQPDKAAEAHFVNMDRDNDRDKIRTPDSGTWAFGIL